MPDASESTSTLAKTAGYVLLFIIVTLLGSSMGEGLAAFFNGVSVGIGSFFQMIRNVAGGLLLAILAIYLIRQATKKD